MNFGSANLDYVYSLDHIVGERETEQSEAMNVFAGGKEIISTLCSRLAKVTPDNYNQQSFKSKHMRKWVDYNEYVRSIAEEINYAEGRIAE